VHKLWCCSPCRMPGLHRCASPAGRRVLLWTPRPSARPAPSRPAAPPDAAAVTPPRSSWPGPSCTEQAPGVGGGKHRGPPHPASRPTELLASRGVLLLNVLRQMLRRVRAQIPAASRRPGAPSRPADRQRHRPHPLGLIANALFQEVGNRSGLHRGQDSDSGMLWLRGRNPGPRVHHRAIGLSAAVDLEDGAAHINPSGLSRGDSSTSPQPSNQAVI